MQTAVAKESRTFDGEIALYVKDLSTGIRYTHNAATPTYLASGIKILVLIAVFEEAAAGRLQWDENIQIQADDVRDGAHVLKSLPIGHTLQLTQLVDAMMNHSDNMATDLLIRRVGIDTVNSVASRYGGAEHGLITSLLDVRRQVYKHMSKEAEGLTAQQVVKLRATPRSAQPRLLAKMLGHKRPFSPFQLGRAFTSYYDSGLNSAPLENVAKVLEALSQHQVVNETASQRMLEILLACRTGKRRVRAGLPAEVLWAHKTGTQHRRMCDLGLYYLPDGRAIVFAACLKSYSSRMQAEAIIARLAKRSYELLTAKASTIGKARATRALKGMTPTDPGTSDSGTTEPVSMEPTSTPPRTTGPATSASNSTETTSTGSDLTGPISTTPAHKEAGREKALPRSGQVQAQTDR